MFRTVAATRSRMMLAGLALGLLATLLSAAPVSAISSRGPDGADLGAQAGDDFSFVVSSTDYGSVSIPSTTVLIYYPNNSGTKTITITDGDICSDPLSTAGNQRDRPGIGYFNGQNATSYYVQSLVSPYPASTVVQGVVSSSNTCFSNTRTLSFPGSLLTYDSSARMYKAQFVANISMVLSQAQNRFSIQLNETGALAGYSSGGDPQEFGVARDAPNDGGYRDYRLPFAPDCSLTTADTKTIQLYDLDYSDKQVQPEDIITYVEEQQLGTSAFTKIPLTISVTNVPLGGNNYVIKGSSKQTISISFTMKPNHRYRLGMQHVYFVNVLQFLLPYDSVYYTTNCYPPAVLSCGSMSPIPGNPEPGEPLRIQSAVNYSGGPPTPILTGPKTVISGSGFSAEPVTTATASGGVATMNSATFTIPNAGVYTATWSVTVDGAPITCSDQFTVESRPFFEVNGGDVVAGSSIIADGGSPCESAVPNQNAGITSWNSRTGPAYNGAGGMYAAFALNYIQDFVTNQGNPYPPTSLSFSNVNYSGSVAPLSGMFGGMFGSFDSCIDYWGEKPEWSSMQPLFPVGVMSGDIESLANGTYKHEGDLTIISSKIINKTRLTIYVEGNLRITPDNSGRGIVYGEGDTNWQDVSHIPWVRIIVNGSIFIDAGVRQLDGLYVAVPDAGFETKINRFDNPEAGTISTCSSGFAAINPEQVGSNGMLAACSKQLTVNGSLVANQLWLLRTLGTVRSNQPAEIFNYGAEQWLAPGDGSYDDSYKSIVGLPPVL